MKKLSIVAMALLVAACGHTDAPDISNPSDIIVDGENLGSAPAPKLPELPPELSKKAEALPPLRDNSVAAMLEDAPMIDRQYNEMAFQLNRLIDAYNCVRTSLNDDADPEKCFGEIE